MKFIFLAIKLEFKKYCLFLTLFFLACGFYMPANAYIVSSIKPIGLITEAVGDNVVKTDILLPDGFSPHVYSLRPKDIQKVKNAELIIWIGKDLETFMFSTLNGVNKTKHLTLMDVPAINELMYRNQHEDQTHHHHHIDSHIWLSPKIAKQIAIAIHDKLIKLYPNKKVLLDKDLNDFVNKLSATEQIIAKKVINIQNRGYFVFHDAYGYFERQFGLKNLGHFTLHPDIQPGAKTVYAIRNQLIGNKAVCVFKEPQFSPTIINKVIEGTNVNIGTLDPLASNIAFSKDAYLKFLISLTSQYEECLGRYN